MGFSIFAYVAVLILVALLSTRLMKILKLPNVTGYIITGILVGPFVFGLLFNNFSYEGIKDSIIYQSVEQIKWVSSVALGFIAFSIGSSFKASTLKAVGKKVFVITIFEALGASLLVMGGLFALHFAFPSFISIELVLVLSAIASATAPAATLMVIKQYNAHGPLVNTLLPVVALDDVAALILFSILFQIASTMSMGGDFSVYKMLFKPLIEIAISLGIGVFLGVVISLFNRVFKSRNNRLAFCIFTIFASLGFYYLFQQPFMGGFELSSLLMCMSAGVAYTNLFKNSGPTLDVLDRFTSPIYMIFFVISGASLDLTIFFNSNGLIVIGIALSYVIFRAVGKWTGAFFGLSITKSEPQVKKYLGLALIPQAGVAIGLSTTASDLFARVGNIEASVMVIAIVLTSTLVYELIGPVITKFALTKAGEVEQKEKENNYTTK